MTEKPDDDDYTPEHVASELKNIAAQVRKGPLEPAELQRLTAEIERLASLVSRLPTLHPVLAERLQQLAEELRNAPVKRKNGHSA